MSTIVCFAVFLAAMITCVILGWSGIWALWLGILLFAVLGLRRGLTVKELWGFAWREGRKLTPLLVFFLLIGCTTGLWRSSGTIAWFIYYGVQIIRPHLFVLVAFLLTCLLSYALGTSFGVVGTAGVILMALGRSGGVSIPVAAGTVLAGAFFGDRCSPASSSALLVAAMTETKQYDNIKMMHKTGLLPMALSLAFFGVLSWRHPLNVMDDALLRSLHDTFSLTPWVVIPAAIMLLLPLFKVNIRWAMLAGVVVAFAESVLCQHLPFADVLLTALRGYKAPAGALQDILSGGGIASMVECSVLVMTTGLLGGLLGGLHVFDAIQQKLEHVADRAGLFPAALLTSTAAAAVFCNQSIAVMMGATMLRDTYEKRGASREELAIDLENSGIVTAGLIPWSIANSIPLAMLGASANATLYAALLYLIPICYLFTKRWFYPGKEVLTK